MPYIKDAQRIAFDELLDKLAESICNDGQMTYCIYRLCLLMARDKVECYDTWKDIMGVLTCTQHELYRRKIADYESMKMVENGDVVI